MAMKNKALRDKLLEVLRISHQKHAVNRNSIFSAQEQLTTVIDVITLMLQDDEVPAAQPQQRYAMPQPGAYGYGQPGYGQPQFPQDRPPTVEEAETLDIPASHETQVFMTHRGTKVVPPAYTGMRPFILPPGAEIPRFPSLAEMGAQGGAVGRPSNPTVMGVHPSGAPPGAAAIMSPAIGHTVAESFANPPQGAVTSQSSVAMGQNMMVSGGIPAELAHMVSGGAQNITGQPVNAFPGGAVITE